jgi:hypothetical protein
VDAQADDRTSLAAVQPVIITDQGQVAFWFGVMKPSPAVAAQAYENLSRAPAEVFPIAFESTVPITAGSIRGTIEGFQFFAEFSLTPGKARIGTVR